MTTNIFIDEQSKLDMSYFNNLNRGDSIAIDTETTGLDPHKHKVIMLAIAKANGDVMVIDTRTVSVEPLRRILEDQTILKLGHNLKFDYNMIRGTFGIKLRGLRDTMLNERLLTSGYVGQHARVGLESVLDRYFQMDLEKQTRMTFPFHVGPFNQTQIEYVTNDVRWLHNLFALQSAKIKKEKLQDVAYLESGIIPAFADIEWYGMLINKDKVHANIAKWEAELDAIKKQIGVYVAPIVGVDMFGEPAITISSVKQISSILEMLGIRGEDGKPLEDTNKDTLLKYKTQHPIIQHLLAFRKVFTSITRYGLPFIDRINPITGRLHPNVNQLGTDTGRPTSKDPNLLNVPRDLTIRNCFEAPEGWKFIDYDYAGCELRILGDNAKDKKFIEGFKSGIDFHCYVASLLFKKEVTKKNENKHLRTPTKGLNFGKWKPGRNKTYSIQGNPTMAYKYPIRAILSESSGNIGSVQRLTAETERLWTGYAYAA